MGIESLQGTRSAYHGSAQTMVSNQPEVKNASSSTDAGSSQRQDTGVIASPLQNINTQNNATTNGEEESNKKQNEQIKRAVSDMNKNAKNTEAVFGIHDGTNRVTIKIVDKETKKVIKEYPPEKTLDMIEKVWEMAGLLVDEKR